MGLSSSPEQLTGKLLVAAEASSKAPIVIVKSCSLVTKSSIMAVAPSRLRNVGKGGSKLSIAFNMGDYPDGAKSLIFARGKGWPIIERDTPPHDIPRATRKKKKVLKFADGEFARSGHHPGTQGKHPFERGAAAATTTFGTIQRREYHAAVGSLF